MLSSLSANVPLLSAEERRRARVGCTALALLIAGAISVAVGLNGSAFQSVIDARFSPALWPLPALGLSLAVFFGIRGLPLLLAATVLGYLSFGIPPLIAAGTAVAVAVEAYLGAAMLQRPDRSLRSFSRVSDTLVFILFVCILTTIVGAILEIAFLGAVGGTAAPNILEGLLHWWIADASSIVVFFPALAVFTQQQRDVRYAGGRLEAAIVLLCAAIATWLVFWAELLGDSTVRYSSFKFMLLPFSVWAALRLGQPGAIATTLTISLISAAQLELTTAAEPAAWSTVLLQFELFLSVLALTGLLAGAVVEERTLSNRRRATSHAVTKILSESDSLGAAGSRLLEAVCRSSGWQCGAIWELTADSTLRCREVWHAPEVSYPDFTELCWRSAYKSGEALPGRVWQQRSPCWVVDLSSERNLPRSDAAYKDGLRAAFGFPIVLNERVLGVIEFLSTTSRQLDHELVELMQAMGQEIGQFIDRTRAQAQVRRLNRDLQHRLRELEMLMETMPAGVAVTRDRSMQRVLLNASLAEMLQLEPSPESLRGRIEISGMPFRLEQAGKEVMESDLPMRRAMDEGAALAPEQYELVLADGSRRQVLISASPLFDQGEVTGCIGVYLDISERARAEERVRENERLYHAIGESIDFGVWISTPGGEFEYVSPSLLRLVGKGRDEFVYEDAVHPEDREIGLKAWRDAVASGLPVDTELRLQAAGGGWQPVLVRGVPVYSGNGEIEHYAGIHLDIARLKLAENRMAEALRSKDNFMAMLGHELRNPLAAINSGVRLLQRPVPPEKHAWIKEMIGRQADQLARLIDDLLDVSRLSRGKLKLERTLVDLRSAVGRAVETARPLIDDQRQELSIDLPEQPVYVDGDQTRLTQVVNNLLSNAAKYSDKHSALSLSLHVQGEEAVLSVKDNGAGISAEMLPIIFDLFTQAEQTLDRSHGGLGLGLSLVRSLVQAHGGRVEARSEGPGKGSEFLVFLPLSTRRTEHCESQGAAVQAAGRYRVLIVDDNRDAADSLGYLLAGEGHQVRTLYSGDGVTETMREFNPDIVLLDIGLPGKNGYEVAHEIRRSRELAGTMLVAMTGFGQKEDIERSYSEGFTHHLVKPIDPQRLQAILASMPDRGSTEVGARA